MNTVWSDYVQGIKTLYCSRKLRFDDMFREQFERLFDLDSSQKLKILEVGCGPGALAEALHRWYPQAEITGVDRDSAFVRFAAEQVKGVAFLEGDATALPFEDHTFDVTISNTVAEHIEPSKFYKEQLRVLKPGGVCLVLSSRRGIHVEAACMEKGDYEQQFWKKVEKYDDSMERYAVCRYPMSETEMPLAMEKYGFRDIHTGFTTIDLTPDHPRFPAEMAHEMINASRYTALEALESVSRTMPEYVTAEEIEWMKCLTNEKYDTRIEQYCRGEKQWDTTVSVIMVLRGKR
ncbi:MAG: methyltransferase domain-containing protein [Ruminococcaceae bacterium]|nr:methyltransferase domain-containing protein [Oscillospiraceae bacterium]